MPEPIILLPLKVVPGRLARPADPALHRRAGATMGTRWSLVLVGGDADAAAALVQRALDAVVAEMSQWEPESELSLFNRAGAGSWHALSPGLFHVLRAGLALARHSDGAFDPTIGAVVDLWGFGPAVAGAVPPDPAALAAALAVSGWRRIGFDAAGRRACQPGGLRLDLSGIAKGHGVDRAVRALEQAGHHNFLIEVGGELAARGLKPDGEPWWVDCEVPPGAVLPPVRIGLLDMAVATSGDYRRYLELDGVRLAHSIDPRTGMPLRDAPALVTVLHPECMIADALATAITVLGVERGLALADEAQAAAIMVTRAADGWEQHLSRVAMAMAAA